MEEGFYVMTKGWMKEEGGILKEEKEMKGKERKRM